MTKMSTLLAALLFASVSAAHAANQPTQPTTGQGAAVTVGSVPANSNASEGLSTAKKNITATHGKNEKGEGKVEKAEHAPKIDRPTLPEHPGR